MVNTFLVNKEKKEQEEMEKLRLEGTSLYLFGTENCFRVMLAKLSSFFLFMTTALQNL